MMFIKKNFIFLFELFDIIYINNDYRELIKRSNYRLNPQSVLEQIISLVY